MWCNSIINNSDNNVTLAKERLKSLEKYAKKELSCYKGTTCVDTKWVHKILAKIDKLWYGNKLMKKVIQEYKKLHIELFIAEEEVSGYVLEVDRKTLGLYLNKDLFDSLFRDEKRKVEGYHVGGLLFKNSLSCLLHVILHETVHIVLTVCEKMGKYVDKNHHGEDFQRITKHLFGHTNSKHGLILGLDHMFDLDTIIKSIQVGDNIKIWISKRWVKGKVKLIKNQTALVEVKINKKKEQYSVDMGLIKIFPTSHLANNKKK